jgi:7-cyano-7-deazaguanine synthase
VSTAILVSGGLDSAVLLADEAAAGRDGRILPVYVSVGLSWEEGERRALELFLSSRRFGREVRALVSLAVDMTDVYPSAHWARTGRPPGYDTPDEDVYLPGRNVVLLGKAGVFCAAAGVRRLLQGTLAGNPFPDATPAFREAMGRALSLGLAHGVTIEAPYAALSKADVIRRGAALGVPMHLTLSCMNPESAGGGMPRHCGACSKCRERHEAFVEARLADPTAYVTPPPRA